MMLMASQGESCCLHCAIHLIEVPSIGFFFLFLSEVAAQANEVSSDVTTLNKPQEDCVFHL